ncbi:MAG: MaoC family dehydratase [Proteobacteria bacterium]|nr:MaoC family dehydratase [Pseudomonadota bacterium]MBU1451629.1 MaoC family dehydratase [Pseudomonadota bacterium]MBU2518002.1 MaoC family dehydratase [Pseudomonadota bacterium]
MDHPQGLSYEALEVGMKASITKTVTESDVNLFAEVSGDRNPVHLDEEFARTTPFGRRIAHGSLVQSLITPVFGLEMPGIGTIALETSARFIKPVFLGDTVTATAEVAEKLPDKKWVRMNCLWTNQRGETVAVGQALMIPPAGS